MPPHVVSYCFQIKPGGYCNKICAFNVLFEDSLVLFFLATHGSQTRNVTVVISFEFLFKMMNKMPVFVQKASVVSKATSQHDTNEFSECFSLLTNFKMYPPKKQITHCNTFDVCCFSQQFCDFHVVPKTVGLCKLASALSFSQLQQGEI